MVSVVLAGGGTAGHTSPLIATAQALREAEPDIQITCVGNLPPGRLGTHRPSPISFLGRVATSSRV